MNDLENARRILEAEGCTCVLCLNGQTLTSHRRGVAPLLELLDSGEVTHGFSAADKVVGKATAMLYRLLGVRAIWGAVMSQSAVHALRQDGIEVHWGQLADHIVNRTGDGPCPMEAATAHTDDPQEALEAIRTALKKLQA